MDDTQQVANIAWLLSGLGRTVDYSDQGDVYSLYINIGSIE